MDIDIDIDISSYKCSACGHIGLEDGNDGFFYCPFCGSQAEDIQETGVADEDFVDKGAGGMYGTHLRRSQPSQRVIKAEPISQIHPDWYDGDYDDGPKDFGEAEKGVGLDIEGYYGKIRLRYVMGLQLMVQLQCEALVQEFGVSPVVCGMVPSVWLRFVSGTGVFDEDWADKALEASEKNQEGDASPPKTPPRYRAEPHNLDKKRAVIIWLRSLRKRIPIHCTLAISFLVCHIARETILPADIVNWSGEGKLPYFGAYVEIEKHIGGPSRACPIPITSMFRPIQSVPAHVLEVLAAKIADSIDLHLPPVNFYAIALRYLKKLSLPVEEILPHACRICEWLMPPELWLSRNEHRFPTCVYVMSTIIVTIRTLFNINGFGYWEKSLSNNLSTSATPNLDPSSDSELKNSAEMSLDFPPQNDLDEEYSGNLLHMKKSKLEVERLLYILEARYHELVDMKEYSMESPAFFQYCNDLAFAGIKLEDYEEVRLVERLWDIYKHGQECNLAGDAEGPPGSNYGKKRFRDGGLDDDEYVKCFPKNKRKLMDEKCHSGSSNDDRISSEAFSGQEYNRDSSYSSQGDGDPGSIDQASADSFRDAAIRKIKLNMEENRFTYIPPRVNVKRFDYLHYARKKDDGAMTYVAHADYYILLRACAKVAQVDVRIMHIAVLSFERRLAWLERRVDYCLHLRPLNISCGYCGNLGHEDALDSSVAFSKLNL